MFSFNVWGTLAYLLWLKLPTESSTGGACGSWSFPQSDMVRQFPGRNPGIPIFPLTLVRFPRYDSFNLLPRKIYALLPIFWELLKRKQRMLIFSLYLNPLLEQFLCQFLVLGTMKLYEKCKFEFQTSSAQGQKVPIFHRMPVCPPLTFRQRQFLWCFPWPVGRVPPFTTDLVLQSFNYYTGASVPTPTTYRTKI